MNIGLLLAAGESERFGKDKLFALIAGKPVIYHSLKFLHDSTDIDAIFIAANARNKNKIEKLVKRKKFFKVKKIILGGKSRFESAKKAVNEVFKKFQPRFLIIHNAANPCAASEELKRCFTACKRGIGGVGVGRKINFTIRQVGKNLTRAILRKNLRQMETPQVVNARIFFNACKKTSKQKSDFTDDLAVLESAGEKTAVCEASPHNIKLTSPEDLEVLRLYAGDLPKNFLTGIGTDSHKFKIQNPKSKIQINFKAQCSKFLRIGGVTIKNLPPLEADSDGDVILHALCNALNSAIGGGSLGTFATALCRKGLCDSKKYIEVILGKIKKAGYEIVNCSLSIEAAKPAIDPLSPALKKSLSGILSISQNRIGITATTGEKLTPFGQGRAIKCTASVLLRKC